VKIDKNIQHVSTQWAFLKRFSKSYGFSGHRSRPDSDGHGILVNSIAREPLKRALMFEPETHTNTVKRTNQVLKVLVKVNAKVKVTRNLLLKSCQYDNFLVVGLQRFGIKQLIVKLSSAESAL